MTPRYYDRLQISVLIFHISIHRWQCKYMSQNRTSFISVEYKSKTECLDLLLLSTCVSQTLVNISLALSLYFMLLLWWLRLVLFPMCHGCTYTCHAFVNVRDALRMCSTENEMFLSLLIRSVSSHFYQGITMISRTFKFLFAWISAGRW